MYSLKQSQFDNYEVTHEIISTFLVYFFFLRILKYFRHSFLIATFFFFMFTFRQLHITMSHIADKLRILLQAVSFWKH